MNPGYVYRVRNYDESGSPELVKVSPAVAARCVLFADEGQYLEHEGSEYAALRFKDPRTGEHYLTPNPEPK
jgi:hypothetical protein